MKKPTSKFLCFITVMFICIITILTIVIIKFNKNNNKNINNTSKSSNMNQFDTYFDTNAKYIEPNSSNNFTYDIKITVDSSKTVENYIYLIYIVSITPKDKKTTYTNTLATGLLDNKMFSYIISTNSLYFGLEKSGPVTIDNKESTGIDISFVGLITKDYDKNKLIDYLKLPILLKISWNKSIEYVKILPSEENIKFK